MTDSEGWTHQEDADEFDLGEHPLSEATDVRRLPKREPKSSLAVRFDATDLDRLRQRADAEGVGITQLVRNWVLERLDEPVDQPVSELMAGLEAAMKAARAIRRSGAPKSSGHTS